MKKSFCFRQDKSAILKNFAQIELFEWVKYGLLPDFKHGSISVEGLTYIYFSEGKFEWLINDIETVLLPNDLLILKPGDKFSNMNHYLEQGSFFRICLSEKENKVYDNNWSGINSVDGKLMEQLLDFKKPMVLQGFKKGESILKKLYEELNSSEISFQSRVNALLDEIFISAARAVNYQDGNSHDFPKVFLMLDKLLRENLSHSWTVTEMARVVGLGTTAFTEKIKYYSGFSPLNYLINLRVAEAMRLLKNSKFSMTDIAFDLGFSSSQHFSSSFKKITGFSPKNYRTNGL